IYQNGRLGLAEPAVCRLQRQHASGTRLARCNGSRLHEGGREYQRDEDRGRAAGHVTIEGGNESVHDRLLDDVFADGLSRVLQARCACSAATARVAWKGAADVEATKLRLSTKVISAAAAAQVTSR